MCLGGDVHGAAVVAVLARALAGDHDVDAVIAEDALQQADIGKPRHVVEDERVLGQQAGDHQRQSGVLGARNRDRAVEPLAADDTYSIHDAPLTALQTRNRPAFMDARGPRGKGKFCARLAGKRRQLPLNPAPRGPENARSASLRLRPWFRAFAGTERTDRAWAPGPARAPAPCGGAGSRAAPLPAARRRFRSCRICRSFPPWPPGIKGRRRACKRSLDRAGMIGYSLAPQRCRSSVVEHPLGKGEVESSILSGSTIRPPASAPRTHAHCYSSTRRPCSRQAWWNALPRWRTNSSPIIAALWLPNRRRRSWRVREARHVHLDGRRSRYQSGYRSAAGATPKATSLCASPRAAPRQPRKPFDRFSAD